MIPVARVHAQRSEPLAAGETGGATGTASEGDDSRSKATCFVVTTSVVRVSRTARNHSSVWAEARCSCKRFRRKSACPREYHQRVNSPCRSGACGGWAKRPSVRSSSNATCRRKSRRVAVRNSSANAASLRSAANRRSRRVSSSNLVVRPSYPSSSPILGYYSMPALGVLSDNRQEPRKIRRRWPMPDINQQLLLLTGNVVATRDVSQWDPSASVHVEVVSPGWIARNVIRSSHWQSEDSRIPEHLPSPSLPPSSGAVTTSRWNWSNY